MKQIQPPAPGMHPGSPWVEYKGGRSSILLSDEEGRQRKAQYMHFDVVEQEPVITGTMGQGRPQSSASFYATPCYDVFPQLLDEDDHQYFRTLTKMPRDLVEGARQLDDYSVHAEVYHAEMAERKLAKVRGRRVHLENAALAFSRAWAKLEGETADVEGERDQSYRRLGAAKVRSRVKELWHTAIVRPQDGGVSHETHDF
jgi:hypothetical protein